MIIHVLSFGVLVAALAVNRKMSFLVISSLHFALFGRVPLFSRSPPFFSRNSYGFRWELYSKLFAAISNYDIYCNKCLCLHGVGWEAVAIALVTVKAVMEEATVKDMTAVQHIV